MADNNQEVIVKQEEKKPNILVRVLTFIFTFIFKIIEFSAFKLSSNSRLKRLVKNFEDTIWRKVDKSTGVTQQLVDDVFTYWVTRELERWSKFLNHKWSTIKTTDELYAYVLSNARLGIIIAQEKEVVEDEVKVIVQEPLVQGEEPAELD